MSPDQLIRDCIDARINIGPSMNPLNSTDLMVSQSKLRVKSELFQRQKSLNRWVGFQWDRHHELSGASLSKLD